MEVGIPYHDTTELKDIHTVLDDQGFAIIKDFQLTTELCDKYKGEVWEALETILPDEYKIERNDKSTWSNYFKLLPLHSMLLQHYGFSQLPSCWNAREKAAPIFSHLWGVKESELVTSMDAISFHIPPESFPRKNGKDRGNTWFHTDQSYLKEEGRCIQGFWNLEECGENDGCLSVLAGSHKYNIEFKEKFLNNIPDNKLKPDWYKLNAEELDFYKTDKKCDWRFVCPPKGCFVIWDSRTIHCGSEPRLPRKEPRFRYVIYVCMLPKNKHNYKGYSCTGLTETVNKKRQIIYDNTRTSSHWPYKTKMFGKQPRTYGNTIPILNTIDKLKYEDMSKLQQSLLGI